MPSLCHGRSAEAMGLEGGGGGRQTDKERQRKRERQKKRDRKRDCETVILFALHAEDKFFYHKITEYGSANGHRKFILKVSVFVT